jgi:ATP-dependent DNA helicase RecG
MANTCQLDSTLADLKVLSHQAKKGLVKLGYETVADVLGHYPKRYEDRTRFDQFPAAASEEPVCLHGVVSDAKQRFMGKRRFFEATLNPVDSLSMGNPVVLRWFNLPYISKVIAVGQHIVFYGRVKESNKRLVMDHPEHEIIEEGSDEEQIHVNRIAPIYGMRDGVTPRSFRKIVYQLVDALDVDSVAPLYDSAEAGFPEMTRGQALKNLHFPSDEDALDEARHFLAFEEFFALQLNVARKRSLHDALPGSSHAGRGYLLKEFAENLPFELTGAQKRAIREIRADLKSTRAMNRLLQGDVGSGKTFVAMAAILLAIESGCQAALMAPTQILAEQHFLVFKKWLEPLDIRISLRTGAKKKAEDLPEYTGGTGEPQIIIGTHALIHGKVEFENLGLVVVDEQHKFGVAQRGKLISQGVVPDVLVMTATPIPRTLTMTVYGDLDVSVLDELPAGRGKIVTAVRSPLKTPEATQFLIQHIDKGRQAYIVYPLIEESEKLKALSAAAEFEKWAERLSPRICDLLHGKVPPDEKDHIMNDFRAGNTDVLVATTVIEVGVDVPNANIMIIYNAERFGLAQLHQLRGRIGRGAHKSYCILMCDPKNVEAMAKLRVLERSCDGFEIAEADLRLRGPGELLGTAQSGIDGLKLGDLVTEVTLVKQARDLANRIITEDPGLKMAKNKSLRSLLVRSESPLMVS